MKNNQLTAEPGITFAVSDVDTSRIVRLTEAYSDIISRTTASHGKLEAYSRDTRPLVSFKRNQDEGPGHGFIDACTMAFARHYPLTLSPDMIWLIIAQGVTRHIRASSEELRRTFVAHDGKVEIIVIRDEFIRGFAGNDWEGVFSEFSTVIRGHIGDQLHSNIVREFSTTGIVERAAFEVTLLDAMQDYFDYIVFTRCGIPSITLLGTPDDWRQIRAAAGRLSELGLDWWTEHLLPTLDQFVMASEGKAIRDFWRSFYKYEGGSGGPYVSGYVANLFPYLSTNDTAGARRNDYLGRQSDPTESGLNVSQLSTGLSIAPFIWDYYRTKIPMKFIAGFVGLSQHPETFALKPEIGWAIVEDEPVTDN